MTDPTSDLIMGIARLKAGDLPPSPWDIAEATAEVYGMPVRRPESEVPRVPEPRPPLRILAGGRRSGKSTKTLSWLAEDFHHRVVIVGSLREENLLHREYYEHHVVRLVEEDHRSRERIHEIKREIRKRIVADQHDLGERLRGLDITAVSIDEAALRSILSRLFMGIPVDLISLQGEPGRDFVIEY